MKTSPLKTTPALLFLALAACTYEPEEVYFKEVPQLEPDVALSLNAYDAVDTIFLWNEASFTYALQQGAGKLERVEVLIDNNVVKTDNAQSGGFSIRRYWENSSYLKTGAHELKIQFVASTGSGSLADVAGAEKFQVWRTWTLMIDVDPPPAPEITFSIENGFLKLSWPAYTKPNFLYYGVSRHDEYSKGTYKKISDPRQNYWIDSTYVGGYSRPYEYQVSTYAFESTTGKLLQKNDVYTFSAGKLSLPDSTITVKWSKSKYYNALKEYAVSENGVVLHRATEVGDTTATVKLKSLMFGTEGSVYFNAVPRYTSAYSSFGNKYVKVMLGTRLRHANMKMAYNQDLNLYVGYSLSHATPVFFHTYGQQLQPLDSIPVASGGSYIPCRGPNVYYHSSTEYAAIDVVTKNKRTRTTTGYQVYDVRGTSNNLVSYSTSFRNSSGGGWTYVTTVYDLVNNVEVFRESRSTSNSCVISEDGSFIKTAPGNQLLKVAGGATTVVGPVNFTFLGFRADKPDEMLARRSSFIDIYDADDLSLIRTIPVPAHSSYLTYISYDPVSKHMVWQDADARRIFLVNVETGASKNYKCYGSVALANGTLFHGNGYYLKVL